MILYGAPLSEFHEKLKNNQLNSLIPQHYNTHHRIPTSRGGTNHQDNLSMVDYHTHMLWHKTFGTMSPHEIVSVMNSNNLLPYDLEVILYDKKEFISCYLEYESREYGKNTPNILEEKKRITLLKGWDLFLDLFYGDYIKAIHFINYALIDIEYHIGFIREDFNTYL